MASDPAGPRITYYGRRHRRAYRAVDGHPGQLGRQDRQPAACRVGCWTRQPGGSSAARALADCGRTVRNLGGSVRKSSSRVTPTIALCTADRLSEADDAVGPGEIAVLSLDGIRQAGDGPSHRGDRLCDLRAGARRPDLTRAPARCRAGRQGRVAEVIVGGQASAAAPGFTGGDRVLSMAGWTTADELTDNLLAVFAAGASLVQVANPDASALATAVGRWRRSLVLAPVLLLVVIELVVIDRVAPNDTTKCHAEPVIGRRQFLVMGAVAPLPGYAACSTAQPPPAAPASTDISLAAARPTSISAASKSIRGRMEIGFRPKRSG